MHSTNLSRWKHEHRFGADNPFGKQRAYVVTVLTAIMMVAEITAGQFFHSMALFADGWHMGTHVVALGITSFAYFYSARHHEDTRFSFGTGKVGFLGGYTSAVLLLVVAAYMMFECVTRLIFPVRIFFNEALIVASIGLTFNLFSAWMLGGEHSHDHAHGHAHDHGHDHGPHHAGKQDLNLRAAYLHVLADAFTSLLAIAALTLGKFFGWSWLDPIIGIVGSLVVAQWAVGLIRTTSRILLDREMDAGVVGEIYEAIEQDGDAKVADLHLVRVGNSHYAVVLTVVADHPRNPDYYKVQIRIHEELAHISVEVHTCPDHAHAEARA